MKTPASPSESRLYDKTDVTDFLPTFVTRTSLRSLLQKIGADKLKDLESHSPAPLSSQPIASESK
jgi:hypothetical protein